MLEEKELVLKLCSLDHDAALLLSRLTSRKYEWIRTRALSRMYNRLTVHSELSMVTSMITLLDCGFIETLGASGGDKTCQPPVSSDQIFNVLSSCVSLVEVKQVCVQMNVSSAESSAGSSSGAGGGGGGTPGTKAQCLQGLWAKCNTQRSLFGHSLVARMASVLMIVLRTSDAAIRSEGIGNGGGSGPRPTLTPKGKQLQRSADKDPYCGALPVPPVVRVTPTLLRFIRRIQRLYNIAGNCLDWIGGGATSVTTPCSGNTAQLVAFKKLRFPATVLDDDCELFTGPTDGVPVAVASTAESECGDCTDDGSLASRRLRFQRWEAANELSCIYEECAANFTLWSTDYVADLLQRAPAVLEGATGPAEGGPGSGLAQFADEEVRRAVVDRCMRAIALARLFDTAEGAPAPQHGPHGLVSSSAASKPESSSSSIVDVVILSDSDEETDMRTSASPSGTGVTAGGSVTASGDVFPPSVVAERLFSAHVFTGRISLRTAVAIVVGVCLMKYADFGHHEARKGQQGARCSGSVPEYISVLNAGTVLAAVLHREAFDIVTVTGVGGSGVDAEVASQWEHLKDFALSTEMLRLLLSSHYYWGEDGGDGSESARVSVTSACSYTPHRRGRWYERVCINLERHIAGGRVTAASMAKPSEEVDGDVATNYLALQYLINSIYGDPHVELGDRLPLTRKLEKLSKKLRVAVPLNSTSLGAETEGLGACGRGDGGGEAAAEVPMEVVDSRYFDLSCRNNLWGLILTRYFRDDDYSVNHMLAGTAGGTDSILPQSIPPKSAQRMPTAVVTRSVWTCGVCTFVNRDSSSDGAVGPVSSTNKRQKVDKTLKCAMCESSAPSPLPGSVVAEAAAPALFPSSGADGVVDLASDSDDDGGQTPASSSTPSPNPHQTFKRIDSSRTILVHTGRADGASGAGADDGTGVSGLTNLAYLFEISGACNYAADINRRICDYSPTIMQIFGVRFYMTDGGASAGVQSGSSAGLVGSNSANGAATGPRFICDNDDVVGVEEYILRILRHPAQYARYMEGSGGGESKTRPRGKATGRRVKQEQGDELQLTGASADAGVELDVSRLFADAVAGGGWEGWHCEGGPLKSLFILLMWDVLYSSSSEHCACQGQSGKHAVFVSPYQVAPLDLYHPEQFLRAREPLIARRLTEISAFSRAELVAEIGRTYRKHYLTSCVSGMNWNRDRDAGGGRFFARRRREKEEELPEWDNLIDRTPRGQAGGPRRRSWVGTGDAASAPGLTVNEAAPVDVDGADAGADSPFSLSAATYPPFNFSRAASSLHSLQLIAACLGGVRAAALCRIFVSNYKYFGAGGPDLLLCRVTRTPCSPVGPEASPAAPTTAQSAVMETAETDLPSAVTPVNFTYERVGGGSHTEVLSLSSWLESHYHRDKTAAAARAYANRAARTGTAAREAAALAATGEPGEAGATGDGGDASNDETEALAPAPTAAAGWEWDDIEPDMLADPGGADEEAQGVADEQTGGEDGNDIGAVPHFNFRCNISDIELPESQDIPTAAPAAAYRYSYDCMFLEVKSPTDHLQHKQSVWLQLLNQYGVAAHICRVIER